MRQSTLDALSLLMSEEDADALRMPTDIIFGRRCSVLRSDLTDAERTAWRRPSPHLDIVLYMAAQNANAPAGMKQSICDRCSHGGRSGCRLCPVRSHGPDARFFLGMIQQ